MFCASQRTVPNNRKALSALVSALIGGVALSGVALAAGPCAGPGAPTPTSPIVCQSAIAIPGNPLTSFDISWVNPTRAEYYLADRSNAGIDVIQTSTLRYQRTIDGFVGAVVANPATNTLNNNISGPDGVTSHGRWLYAGDGNSTLKVIDLQAQGTASDPAIKQSIATGGTTRVDEMALNGPGTLLLAANNAEDPPFATLFAANGDNTTSNVTIIAKINVDTSIIPQGLGLSLEQPTWDPGTQRFYVSVPQINYPQGCTPNSLVNSCYGGLLVIDPNGVHSGTTTYGPFDASVNAGMLALSQCGPNGIVVGLNENLLLGCTPANMPNNIGTLVINALTKNSNVVLNITGSDEVTFNPGDNLYFTASSANRADINGPPALGVIDAQTNQLVGTIPEGSGSHSVAADSQRNFIFVPQVVPKNVNGPPGAGSGDTTGVSASLCGTSNGCVAVYFDQSPFMH